MSAARRSFRVAVAADLHADLVDEDHHGLRLGDRARELAQGLGHQAGLKAGQRVAHVALNFALGRQRGDRVHDNQVDGARAHEGVGDLKGLFARVGLGDQKVGELHAETLCVLDVERVFRVNEGARTADLLHFGDDLQGERRLAGGFGTEHLDDATAGQTAHAERKVKAQGARGNRLDVLDFGAVGHAHDGALAELLFNIGKRDAERLLAFLPFATTGAGRIRGLGSHDGLLSQTITILNIYEYTTINLHLEWQDHFTSLDAQRIIRFTCKTGVLSTLPPCSLPS